MSNYIDKKYFYAFKDKTNETLNKIIELIECNGASLTSQLDLLDDKYNLLNNKYRLLEKKYQKAIDALEYNKNEINHIGNYDCIDQLNLSHDSNLNQDKCTQSSLSGPKRYFCECEYEDTINKCCENILSQDQSHNKKEQELSNKIIQDIIIGEILRQIPNNTIKKTKKLNKINKINKINKCTDNDFDFNFDVNLLDGDIDININDDNIASTETNNKVDNDDHADLEYVTFENDINSVDDMLDLCAFAKAIKETWDNDQSHEGLQSNQQGEYDSYYLYYGKKYGINFDKVLKLEPSLKKLKKMVGINSVKNQILDTLCAQLIPGNNERNIYHTLIYGDPGMGKTKLSKILAQMYCSMGLASADKIVNAKRSTLIGQHLGHTAVKTQEVIDSAIGGVLIIDEGYSLGNEEAKDSFSKECIDVLTQNLSDNKKKFICIVIGYEDAIKKNLFNYNKGLEGRFTIIYTIDKYNPSELATIFIANFKKCNYTFDCDESEIIKLFMENGNKFINYGRDVKTYLQNCKNLHMRNILGKNVTTKNIIKLATLSECMRKIKQDDSNCLSYYR